MLTVILSAYIIAFPFRLRAARPIVWVSERWLRKKPSLSASNMATNETSGKSKPSRSRFTPISTSNNPLRKSCMISMRSKVSTSEWMYRQRILTLVKYLANSSAIRLVKVVTNTRSSISARCWISSIKSSIWFKLGRISITGSKSPVGRITCSTTTPIDFCNS